MSWIADKSVDLIVTSPAYPMIEMWDSLYGNWNAETARAFNSQKGDKAFDLIHRELDKTWAECCRVLKQGGFACINIGDAVRTMGEELSALFQSFPHHQSV